MNTTNKHGEAITRDVIQTTDYSVFHTLQANRPVSETHVRSIIKSIEDDGSWLLDEPILVNEDMEVVDGQHRLAAHKQLDLPIYYTVATGIGVERAHAMNKIRRNWTILDWAESYANDGNLNYQRWLKLLEENDTWTPAILIAACDDKPLRKGLHGEFRGGELQLPEDYIPVVQSRMNNLDELAELAPSFVTTTAARYVLQIFTHPKYDQERMATRMQEVGPDAFTPTTYVGSILAQMERVYNRGADLSNLVRFQ